LINLRRQQRIRWAAMQFLQESQRRNRRWILLKQLLLLATRMAVIAVLVLMLAHLVVRNEWLRLLGTGTTHHLVLLDDSYSMSDRWDDTNALAEAKRSVQAIVDQAYQQSDTQLITLLRFSEAAKLSAGAQPKVFGERINDEFRSRLESLLAGWETSQTDVGPADALKAVPRLPLADAGQTLVVYLISDFRARQFASASEIRKLLADLGDRAKRRANSSGAMRQRGTPEHCHHLARARVGREGSRRRNVDERDRGQLRRHSRARRDRSVAARWRRLACPGARRYSAAR
jgi:hypothetical protein